MANRWKNQKVQQATEALIEAGLEYGGSLTYSEGWEKIRRRKNEKGMWTGIVGSYSTYDKILKDLVDRGLFSKGVDPQDGRVSILRLRNADQAATEMQFLRAFDQIKTLVDQPSFPISPEDWHKDLNRAIQGKPRGRLSERGEEILWKHPYLVQHKKIVDLLFICHNLFLKDMRPKPYNSAHYDGAYISAHDGAITVLSRLGHDSLVECDRMLRKILAEGKKDPEKELWLKQFGAYDC